MWSRKLKRETQGGGCGRADRQRDRERERQRERESVTGFMYLFSNKIHQEIENYDINALGKQNKNQ